MADVLKVEPSARFKLTRNGINLYSQHFAPASQAYTEHTSDRLILATNMAAVQELDLGGVTTGEFLLVETDNSVKIGVDNQTVLTTVNKAFMLSGASFTHIYLQNVSTTNTATIQAVVAD
jgi:hypothetical protein